MAAHAEYCDAVQDEIARFVSVAARLDPGTGVVTCPGWTVGKLMKHVGSTHRWATHIVATRAQHSVATRSLDLELPDDASGYPAWLADGAVRLDRALRAAAPDEPVWSWGTDQHVRFWSRRMLYETLVHRVDAEVTGDVVPVVGADVAADGISEFLTNLHLAPRPSVGLRELRGSGEVVALVGADVDDSWAICLQRGGFSWRSASGQDAHGQPADGTRTAPAGDAMVRGVTVRGATADLLLLVHGRLAPTDERVTVTGERAVLDNWLTATAF